MKTVEEKQNDARNLWHSSEAFTNADANPVTNYLKRRGLGEVHIPPSLRFHPKLAAFKDSKPVGQFPAMIAAIVDADKRVIGVHRTYLTADGVKADLGSETKKIMGVASGGCIKLHDSEPIVVGVAEGIETCLSVAVATGLPMIAPATGSVMPTMPLARDVTTVHIWADLDQHGAGSEYAHKLALRLHEEGKSVFLHFPTAELLDGSDTGDWNDVLKIKGSEPIRSSFEQSVVWSPQASDSGDWPQRLALPSKLPPVPTLSPDFIPHSLRTWLVDEATRLQVSLELVACAAIVVMASLVGRRCGIYPKQKDSWLVVPDLWGGIISPPSTLKTPGMNAATAPLRALDAKFAKDFKKRLSDFEHQKEQCDLKIAAIKNRIKKRLAAEAPDEEALKADEDEIKKLKDEIRRQEPIRRRYMINDATIEKLAELLRDNPAGLFLYRDELYGFLQSLEKQGHGGARAFYLEAWTGLGSFSVDRIGRGTLDVPALCISIFGGIQPEKLNQYFAAALEHGSGDDGFLSRFQLLVFPDKPSSYKYTDAEPNAAAYSTAKSIAETLVGIDYKKIATEIDLNSDLPAMRFSADAQDIFADWLQTFSCDLLRLDEDSAFISHLSKYPSLVPSLALIFFLIEHCNDEFPPRQIPKHFLEQAIEWSKFLEQHARRIYGAVLHADIHAAHALAKKISQGKIADCSTIRDIYRNEWAGLRSREAVQGGLNQLQRLNWIKVIELPASSKGGASSEVIKLHPDFLKGASRD